MNNTPENELTENKIKQFLRDKYKKQMDIEHLMLKYQITEDLMDKYSNTRTGGTEIKLFDPKEFLEHGRDIVEKYSDKKYDHVHEQYSVIINEETRSRPQLRNFKLQYFTGEEYKKVAKQMIPPIHGRESLELFFIHEYRNSLKNMEVVNPTDILRWINNAPPIEAEISEETRKKEKEKKEKKEEEEFEKRKKEREEKREEEIKEEIVKEEIKEEEITQEQPKEIKFDDPKPIPAVERILPKLIKRDNMDKNRVKILYIMLWNSSSRQNVKKFADKFDKSTEEQLERLLDDYLESQAVTLSTESEFTYNPLLKYLQYTKLINSPDELINTNQILEYNRWYETAVDDRDVVEGGGAELSRSQLYWKIVEAGAEDFDIYDYTTGELNELAEELSVKN